MPPVQPLECPTCGAVREVPLILVAGRPMVVRATDCEECAEQKAEAAAREERERQRREHQAKIQARRDSILDLLHASGVNPWEHGHCTLENFDARESGELVVQTVRRFLDTVRSADRYEPVQGIYLFGGTGAGKSHLAAAAVRDLLLDVEVDPGTIIYDHALSLIGEIQRTYSSGESAADVLERRVNARMWVLDDLGTEAPSADVVRRLTEIITRRALRPTIITSNYRPDELEARSAELFRVASRLGPRYMQTVEVGGSDWRFRAA